MSAREKIARKLASYDGNLFEGKYGIVISERDKEIYRKRADEILVLAQVPGLTSYPFILGDAVRDAAFDSIVTYFDAHDTNNARSGAFNILDRLIVRVVRGALQSEKTP